MVVKPKTIAYIRVSTSEQNTQVQKYELMEYSQRHKFVIDEFIEIEISSRKSQEKRKIEYLKNQLNKNATANDTVICTELSRLGRSMIEILTLIEWFKENNISVIFTKQPELSTNKDNALQSLLFSIYGYFAESERELLSQRVKSGMRNAKAQGKQIGRKKGSYGVSVFDPYKERILELRSLGLSLNKITKHIEVGTAPALLAYLRKLEKIKQTPLV